MSRSHFQGLVVAIVAGLVLLPNLGGPALWDDDEPKNAACSLAMLDAGDWVVPTFNGRLRIEKPALVNWVQIAGYTACGRNELGARIGSAVLTIGTCLLTWRIGCLIASPAVGMLGGLAMASCVWTAIGGRAATPDAPLCFCTTLALLLFVRGTGGAAGAPRLSRRAALAIGLACGAAVLAKGPVGLVLPVGAFALHGLTGSRGRSPAAWLESLGALRLPLIAAAAAVVAAPWYAWVTVRTEGAWLRGFLLVHNLDRFATSLEGHSGSPLAYYPLTIAVGLFPWSIVLAAVVAHTCAILRRPGQPATAGIRLLACWTVVWIGAFSCAGTKLPGYVWPAYPALALLTGAFLDDWRRGGVGCVAWCRDPSRAISLVMRTAWTVLAVAGVALGIGLPLAARAVAPGAEWLGGLGLIPIAAALVAWSCHGRGRPTRALQALAACSCLLVALLAAVGAERFGRAAGMRAFVAAGLPRPVGDYAWAALGTVPPSFVFYSRSQVASAETAERAARHLAAGDHARLIVVDHLERHLAPLLPAGCRVLARIPTLGGDTYLVFGTPPSGRDQAADLPLAAVD